MDPLWAEKKRILEASATAHPGIEHLDDFVSSDWLLRVSAARLQVGLTTKILETSNWIFTQPGRLNIQHMPQFSFILGMFNMVQIFDIQHPTNISEFLKVTGCHQMYHPVLEHVWMCHLTLWDLRPSNAYKHNASLWKGLNSLTGLTMDNSGSTPMAVGH